MQNSYNGGLALTNIVQRIKTNHIQRIRKLHLNLEQPWVCLYIYWFGLYIKNINQKFATNRYIHTLNVPINLRIIKNNILETRHNEEIWETPNLKAIYKILIDNEKYIPKMCNIFTNSNWNLVWKLLFRINNIQNRNILYQYLHKILPTGEYFMKIYVVKEMPKCSNCNDGFHTYKHIFEQCKYHEYLRNELHSEIKETNPNIEITSELVQTGSNIKDANGKVDEYICKLIFAYVIKIWKISKLLTDK